jgi:hypothetical protein
MASRNQERASDTLPIGKKTEAAKAFDRFKYWYWKERAKGIE